MGLGSYVQWDRKLDGLLCQAIMSIPAIKGAEIGLGIEGAHRLGSQVHDRFIMKMANLKDGPIMPVDWKVGLPTVNDWSSGLHETYFHINESSRIRGFGY